MGYGDKYVWSGTMKLANVASYLAECMNVPEAAIEIKFKWPSTKTGRVETVPADQLNASLTDLRSVWR